VSPDDSRTRVNVNTTDATAGATALLLPAQNTHTLHDPKRDTERVCPAQGVNVKHDRRDNRCVRSHTDTHSHRGGTARGRFRRATCPW